MKLRVEEQSLAEEGFKGMITKAAGEEIPSKASKGGHLASNLVVKTEVESTMTATAVVP